MNETFLQQKLGELIYLLGEHNFNAITPEFWNKHINKQETFTQKQLEEFALFVSELTVEVIEIEEEKPKEESRSNLDKAIQILKENGLREVEVCRFGIYYQYELAGERISVQSLEWLGAENEEILGDRYDDIHDELSECLGFIDEDYIYDVLGYDDEGQNALILTQKGFITRKFRI
jgi:DNA-binding transcriptional ArsR family regulator